MRAENTNRCNERMYTIFMDISIENVFFTSTIIPNNPQYKPHASWTDHLKWYRIVFAASIDNNIRKGLSFNMIFENKENKVRNSKTYHNPFTNIKKEIISCCVGLLNALIKYAFRFWLCIVHYYRTDILMWLSICEQQI